MGSASGLEIASIIFGAVGFIVAVFVLMKRYSKSK